MSAESFSERVASHSIKVASMRPRFVERGKFASHRQHLVRDRASMRPRFVERGKQTISRRLKMSNIGFNEAALR